MFGSGRGQQHSTPRPIDVPTRGYGQADDRPCRHTPYTTGPMLNGTKATRVSSNEKRRARQDAYRQELDVQVAEDRERRNLDAQKIREVEKRHELKSVSSFASKNASEYSYERTSYCQLLYVPVRPIVYLLRVRVRAYTYSHCFMVPMLLLIPCAAFGNVRNVVYVVPTLVHRQTVLEATSRYEEFVSRGGKYFS